MILARDPAERPTADQLKKVLEDYDQTGTVGSFTSPWVDLAHARLDASGVSQQA